MHAVITLMTDVLVIGSGMAGCRAAIAAADKGSDVILATKKTLGCGASTYPVAEMAGYNAGDRTKINDIEGHYRDMVVAGQGMANPTLARILAEHAPDTISELEKWGVVFEKENGHYYVFQSCFASAPRTHVVRGHGVPIVNAMIRQIKLRQNIKIVEDVVIAELSVQNGVCCGGWGVRSDGKIIKIGAKAVIIASGGASQVFERNMNPDDVSGDGYTLAYSAGAELINMEFMQSGVGFSYPLINMFNGYIWAAHPKLYNNSRQMFLEKYLTPSMNSEYVMNEHRRHFPFSTSDDSKYLEIGIQKEICSGNGTPNCGIYADLRHMTDKYINSIYDDCGLHHMWKIARDYMRGKGVDLLKQTVEVAVYAHAINGGINIDAQSSSTLPGLYAAGEAAGGPHGADRLGGNMMVTCQVFGKIAGESASAWAAREKNVVSLKWDPSDNIMQVLYKELNTDAIIKSLKQMNQQNLLICRNELSLNNVLNFVETSLKAINEAPTSNNLNLENIRLYSMLLSTKIMANAALERKESRGSHYREDYPKKDPLQSNPISKKIELQ